LPEVTLPITHKAGQNKRMQIYKSGDVVFQEGAGEELRDVMEQLMRH
jgi:hypothetical protein